ncbi:MAG: DNA polymerase IV [Deltaproteobacteria bacterium]|nr:DNA polymerase IV [Deltaproteobacteria bacterium]
MHVDMDAFFASVEQRGNPWLRGRPIAVSGSGWRSVVTSASYQARPFGISAGMPVAQAIRLCPALIRVEGNSDKYVETSEQVIALLREVTPLVEVASIDECYLDITGSLRLFGGAEALARRVKARIREEVGLACSVGVAPNKLMAKLASGLSKPDGLLRLTAEELPAWLEHLPVTELCGIGPRLGAALTAMGVRTCAELSRVPVAALTARFGIVGRHLHEMARGVDSTPVVPTEERPDAKSVGHTLTLDQDLHDREPMRRHLFRLAEEVARRLRKGRYAGRTVTVMVRYADFVTWSRQTTLEAPLDEGLAIYDAARRVFDGLRLRPLGVRLLGVTVSHLVHARDQLPLLPSLQRRRASVQAMDAVNDRYGEFTLTRATLLQMETRTRPISPSWRPLA